MSIFIFLD